MCSTSIKVSVSVSVSGGIPLRDCHAMGGRGGRDRRRCVGLSGACDHYGTECDDMRRTRRERENHRCV